MDRQNPKRLYLDICTLCRPFDDQSQMRIRLEINAYYLILQALQGARYMMVVSPVHFEEVNAISDAEERREILTVLDISFAVFESENYEKLHISPIF